MGRVQVVYGTGTGPTALASYDAALAAANVHDYNLLRVSSVLPVGTNVEPVGVAPDLGPIGGKLTVVEARETIAPFPPGSPAGFDDSNGSYGPDENSGLDNTSAVADVDSDRTAGDRIVACAGLGWAQAENGRGIVYEATGSDPENVRRRIDEGLRAGCALRDFVPARTDRVVRSTDREHDERDPEYTTAVVLAIYGNATPIIEPSR